MRGMSRFNVPGCIQTQLMPASLASRRTFKVMWGCVTMLNEVSDGDSSSPTDETVE